jgi:cytochrome c peroxidase|tara:strand:- start:1981 stop:3927 length:1947 start_codon:yes stop_codon:yes gene_type:complete
MRSDNILLLISFFLSTLLIIASKPKINTSDYVEKSIGLINRDFQSDLQTFKEASVSFQASIEEYIASDTSEATLKTEYRKLRNSFKKVEFLLEYLDKEASDRVLNGPPLPKLEPKVSDIKILQPKGLQVLDELLGSEDLASAKKELLDISSKFTVDVKKIAAYFEYRKISDRQFFEASRQAIIRMATLGITGFDTPGTLQGLDDSTVILATLKSHFNEYEPELKNVARFYLLKSISAIFDLGTAQTTIGDFNTFDRLIFIKDVLNPLYKTIKDIHLALDYETIEEVSSYPLAVNYNSENIFEKDFLNNFYYVSIANDSNFNKVADLGRLLFYDPILSQNNKLACASCHAPEKAFTDGLKTSYSNTGEPLKRNAMTLNYAVYASGFFYDLRASRLEDQFEHVILNKDEFNSDYKDIVKKLKDSENYSQLFKEAFLGQSTEIKFNNVDYALVAYVMQLNSFDSPIDKYFQEKTSSLPESVKRGFNLFSGKAACATCHFMPLYSGNLPPLFIDSESEILGVPKNKDNPLILDDDLGRIGNGLTQEIAPFYQNAFKTPTLRNIAKTGPYMHNGVFDTLDEVMDFYNEGGGVGRGIDLEYQTLASDSLNLTETEIKDIIAFLEALTDETTVEAPSDLPRDFKDANLNLRNLIK